MQHVWGGLLVAGGLVGLWPATAAAQCGGSEDQKLTAGNAAPADAFGSALGASGSLLLVGAPQHDSAAGSNAGAAYAYRFDGVRWVGFQELSPADSAPSDLFGSSVALDRERALIGAPFRDAAGGPDSGATYVYRFDGSSWVWEQTLTASDGSLSDHFGSAVALAGDLAVVGAQDADLPVGSDAGAAYVYRRDASGWAFEQKLLASDGAAVDRFAGSVAAWGDRIVVGAPLAAGAGGPAAGAAYVFFFNGSAWSEEAKLIAGDAALWSVFGASVAVRGSRVLIGASLHDTATGTDAGAAYVFERDAGGWSEVQRLTAASAGSFDRFGTSVVLREDRALIGADQGDGPTGAGVGAVYLFRHDGSRWTEQRHLSASDGAPGDGLGQAIAASAEHALAGAPSDDTAAGTDVGSALVWRLSDLALDANRDEARAGDFLALTTCGGLPGALVLLAAVQVNGAPTFANLGVGVFDSTGRWSLAGTIPAGFAGLAIDFQSLGFYQPGRIGWSNLEGVAFR